MLIFKLKTILIYSAVGASPLPSVEPSEAASAASAASSSSDLTEAREVPYLANNRIVWVKNCKSVILKFGSSKLVP